MYILVEGRCSLSVFSENGKEKVLLYFSEGDFVGYVPLLSIDKHHDLTGRSFYSSVSIYAKTDCTLARISQATYDEAKKDVDFREAIYDSMFRHYRQLITLQQVKANKSAGATIAAFILNYSTCAPDGKYYLDGSFTFAEIAKAVELHPVSVGRIIGALRMSGAVERKGHCLQVSDPELLNDYAEETIPLRY